MTYAVAQVWTLAAVLFFFLFMVCGSAGRGGATNHELLIEDVPERSPQARNRVRAATAQAP
jgi:hypothetical protein